MNPLALFKRFFWALAILVGVVSCASYKPPPPSPLLPLQEQSVVQPTWRFVFARAGAPLEAKQVAGTLFVANATGALAALDTTSGTVLWQADLGQKLLAGLGADARHIAVVAADNSLIVLSSQGSLLWKASLPARTFTAPLVAGGRVFVLTSDRSLVAYDVDTGRRLWYQSRSSESLVLGQAGLLTAVGDTLVVGFAGRVSGVSPQSGVSLWDTTLTTSRGTNEVERLIDVVSGSSRVGSNVCVRAFLSVVGCVDASTGKLLWVKSSLGSTGLAGNSETLFGTESDGKVVAFRRKDGERLWSTDTLRYRGVTGPLLSGDALVLGDAQGYVHWLSLKDGKILRRAATSGAAVVGIPLLVDGTAVVTTQAGGVFAFKPE